MSLINEALKRTETDKLNHLRDGAEHPALVPVPGERVARPFSPLVTLLLAVAIPAVGAGGWIVVEDTTWLSLPSRTSAASRPAFTPTDMARGDNLAEAEAIIAKSLRAAVYHEPLDRQSDMAAVSVDLPVAGQSHAIKPASSFELSAVMRGPDGATAIINGKFIKVGTTIDGAKLVKVGRHTAELESGGRRFTIQM